MNYLEHFSEMIALRGLKESTRKTYVIYISAYLEYIAKNLGKSPEDVSWSEMRAFIQWIQEVRGLSDRTINYVIAQLRFFTLYVLHLGWDPYQLPYRKYNKYIPFIPTREEVQTIINAIDDVRVRTMVMIMYGGGLRIGEVCNLRTSDIDSASMRLHIAMSKNRSERYALLPQVVLEQLRKYWVMYSGPRDILFHRKNDPHKPVSAAYVNNQIRKAEEKLGWPHRFTCHTFRRAFATHFYEDTLDLMALKELMGHRSLRSTTVYVTLSSRTLHQHKSPIESLQVRHD